MMECICTGISSFLLHSSLSGLVAMATQLRESFSTDSTGRLVTTFLATLLTRITGKGPSAIVSSFFRVSFSSVCAIRRKTLSPGWIDSLFFRTFLSKFRFYRSWDFSNFSCVSGITVSVIFPLMFEV